MSARKNGLTLIVLSMLALFFVSPLEQTVAATVMKSKKTTESLLEELRSPDIQVRVLALSAINKNIKTRPLTPDVIEQILRLAEQEKNSHEAESTHGELGQDYLIQLIDALANTHNARAVPYLIEHLGSGMAVMRGLNNAGDPAIDPLIEKLHDEKASVRSEAATALSLFLDSSQGGVMAKGTKRKEIKQELIKEINNKRNQEPEKNIEHYQLRSRERAAVRLNIVKALGFFAESGDKEVIPILKAIAEQDTYAEDYSKKSHKDEGKKYKVRDEAQKALDKLERRSIGR